jgi:hypothetical protein
MDDLFDDAINHSHNQYKLGYDKGREDGLIQMIGDSREKGRDFGYDVGNELAYYKSTVETLADVDELFGSEKNKAKFVKSKDALVSSILGFSLEDCYEPSFEEELQKIKLGFKKIMML